MLQVGAGPQGSKRRPSGPMRGQYAVRLRRCRAGSFDDGIIHVKEVAVGLIQVETQNQRRGNQYWWLRRGRVMRFPLLLTMVIVCDVLVS